MLVLENKTTEGLITLVEPALTAIIARATRLREKSDIGIRGMAKLYGIMTDAQAKVKQLLRLKGRFLNEEQIDKELGYYNNWIDETNDRISVIYREEVVGTTTEEVPTDTIAPPVKMNTLAGVPVFLIWTVIGCFIFAFITAVVTLLG